MRPCIALGRLVLLLGPAVFLLASCRSSTTPTVSAALSNVVFTPSSIVGGAATQGVVTLISAAPSGGASVGLASSSPAASLPPAVLVAAGATTATFTVATSPVTSITDVTITASYGGANRTASINISPPAGPIAGFTITPSTVAAGVPAQGAVTLSAAAPPAGATVVLSSSNQLIASVPASIAVAGGSRSATFAIATSAVTAPTIVTITASFGGTNRSATITVTPPLLALAHLTVSPSAIVGGLSAQGIVTLSSPAASGGAAILLSSNSASASVPGVVTVAAGASAAAFAINTSPVVSTSEASITAVFGGVSRTTTLTITQQAPLLSTVTVNPSSVKGGTSAVGTVTLASAAPAGGLPIALSSGGSAVAVPPAVTVGAGSTSATFAVTTFAVSAPTQVTVTAAQGGTTRTVSLALTP
jgi:hypothetical protein